MAAESIIVVTANFCIALLSSIFTLANAWKRGVRSAKNKRKDHQMQTKSVTFLSRSDNIVLCPVNLSISDMRLSASLRKRSAESKRSASVLARTFIAGLGVVLMKLTDTRKSRRSC